jgi:hypothetical protein
MMPAEGIFHVERRRIVAEIGSLKTEHAINAKIRRRS